MRVLTLYSNSNYVLTSTAGSALLDSKQPENGAMALKNDVHTLDPAHLLPTGFRQCLGQGNTIRGDSTEL